MADISDLTRMLPSEELAVLHRFEKQMRRVRDDRARVTLCLQQSARLVKLYDACKRLADAYPLHIEVLEQWAAENSSQAGAGGGDGGSGGPSRHAQGNGFQGSFSDEWELYTRVTTSNGGTDHPGPSDEKANRPPPTDELGLQQEEEEAQESHISTAVRTTIRNLEEEGLECQEFVRRMPCRTTVEAAQPPPPPGPAEPPPVSLCEKKRQRAVVDQVAAKWGRRLVRHYGWHEKPMEFVNTLRDAARTVPRWKTAVKKLNAVMLMRHTDRNYCQPIADSVSPVLTNHLVVVAAGVSCTAPPPPPPRGLGYDRYGLIVLKKYETPTPMPTPRAPAVEVIDETRETVVVDDQEEENEQEAGQEEQEQEEKEVGEHVEGEEDYDDLGEIYEMDERE